MGKRMLEQEPRKLNISKVIISVFLIALVIVVVYFVFYNQEENNNNDNNDNYNNIENNQVYDEELVGSTKKTIEEIISEFGGDVKEQVKSDTYYITKDGVDYTVYLDGEIIEGIILPWTGNEAKPAIDADGNINIYSADELKWVANQVISGEKNFSGVTITLRKNIDLGARKKEDGTWEGTNWNSIIGFLDELPNKQNVNTVVENTQTDVDIDDSIDVTNENLKKFAGVFNGNGFSIRGMNINTDKRYQGLFGYNSGDISNLTIKHSNISAGEASGALVGLNEGKILNCKIQNVTISGTDKVGGMIGIAMTNSSIAHCTIGENTTIKGNNYVGGIARLYK